MATLNEVDVDDELTGNSVKELTSNIDNQLKPFVVEEKLEELKRDADRYLAGGSYGFVNKVKVGRVSKKPHLTYLQLASNQKSTLLRRFKREYLMLSKLKHPYIVQLIELYYGEGGKDDIAMFMERLQYDLYQFLNQTSNIKLSTKLSILQDVACGLVYLHEYNPPILHRDLTVQNVMLARIPPQADVGVAKLMDKNAVEASRLTQVPCQASHMPPETRRENPVYTFKLDIFSFGHLTLHAILEKCPDVFEIEFAKAMKYQCMNEVLKCRRALDQVGADHQLRSLIAWCLQDNPDRRPTTQQLNKAITLIMEELSVSYIALETLCYVRFFCSVKFLNHTYSVCTSRLCLRYVIHPGVHM